MFGWLKKLTGGARSSAVPPVPQAPLPVAPAPDSPERTCAPLTFLQPANIDPFSTLFGIVRLSRKGEAWPTLNGEPLLPLMQVNLVAAPMVPDAVRDLSLITVFISERDALAPTPIINTQEPDPAANWALRSYATLVGLTIPRPPLNTNRLSPLLGEWLPLRREQRPDCGTAVNSAAATPDMGVPVQRTKLGGWPVLANAAPWWANSDLPDTWDFVLQIENEPKAGWQGWSEGAACIARSRQRPHLWAIDVPAHT